MTSASRVRLVVVAVLAAPTISAGACTLEDGHGWVTVSASASGALYVDAAHASIDGGGTFVTDRGFRITLDALDVTFAELHLLEPASGGAARGSVSFDPEDPPPGYTLCHGGHCHTEDGQTRSYEEIEAELARAGAGGGAVTSTRVAEALPVSGGLQLLATPPSTADLGAWELGDVDLAAVAIVLGSFHLHGQTTVDGAPVALTVELAPPDGLRLEASLAAKLGRGGKARAPIEVFVEVAGDLLDGLALENLVLSQGELRIDAAHNAAIADILTSRVEAEAASASFASTP